jgi:hypothetical protein
MSFGFLILLLLSIFITVELLRFRALKGGSLSLVSPDIK